MKCLKSIISSVCLAQIIMLACIILPPSVPCFGQTDRESWQPPEKIMDSIGVRPGMRVGEAGAGQGYFTFPLARRVGSEGMVFANDISTESLDIIRDRAVREGLKNIKIVVGDIEDPLFPEHNLDMVIMVLVSSFKATLGTGPRVAHMAIANGLLFIRHGMLLMAYDLKQRS